MAASEPFEVHVELETGEKRICSIDGPEDVAETELTLAGHRLCLIREDLLPLWIVDCHHVFPNEGGEFFVRAWLPVERVQLDREEERMGFTRHFAPKEQSCVALLASIDEPAVVRGARSRKPLILETRRKGTGGKPTCTGHRKEQATKAAPKIATGSAYLRSRCLTDGRSLAAARTAYHEDEGKAGRSAPRPAAGKCSGLLGSRHLVLAIQ